MSARQTRSRTPPRAPAHAFRSTSGSVPRRWAAAGVCVARAGDVAIPHVASTPSMVVICSQKVGQAAAMFVSSGHVPVAGTGHQGDLSHSMGRHRSGIYERTLASRDRRARLRIGDPGETQHGSLQGGRRSQTRTPVVSQNAEDAIHGESRCFFSLGNLTDPANSVVA